MISFTDVPPEIVQAMITPMHLIPLPAPHQRRGSLYLGSLSASVDQPLLEAHKITHLVQVLDAAWLDPSAQQRFHCYQIRVRPRGLSNLGIIKRGALWKWINGSDGENIQVDDHPTVELGSYLEAACEWVDRALRAGGNVLVHCQQGISRSPSIVIAYLIRQHSMSYDEAFALCRSTRACIKPNRGFVRTLKEWEVRCRDRRVQSPSSSATTSSTNSSVSSPSGSMNRPDLLRRFTN